MCFFFLQMRFFFNIWHHCSAQESYSSPGMMNYGSEVSVFYQSVCAVPQSARRAVRKLVTLAHKALKDKPLNETISAYMRRTTCTRANLVGCWWVAGRLKKVARREESQQYQRRLFAAWLGTQLGAGCTDDMEIQLLLRQRSKARLHALRHTPPPRPF